MMKSELPSVAIITVFYNREEHVYDSINSLLKQTYENLQIIVVDDCSTDSTREKIRKFEGLESRLQIVFNSHNKGFTRVLIDTIADLKVKYVAIHGAGDISLPTRIEEQVKYIESNQDVGVLTTDIVNIKQSIFHQSEITLKHLLKKNRIIHGAVMFRLEDYVKVGGYRSFFTYRQDKDLWFRMSLVTKIHYYDKKLYHLASIRKSVSKEASYTGIPILMSEFAKFLIFERMKNGYDSLEKYGIEGILFFKSTYANKQLFYLFLQSLKINERVVATNYLNILIKINSNIIILLFLKLIKKVICFSLSNQSNQNK